MDMHYQSSAVGASPLPSHTKRLREITRTAQFTRRLSQRICLLAFLLLIGHCATALCLNEVRPSQRDSSPCPYSDQIYNGDASLMQRREAPTHFRLMTSRYVEMLQSVRGYRCSETTTVGFDGHRFLQTGRNDDPGIMEMIPTLSRLIGWSLEDTYDVTMFAVIVAGLLIGYAGFFELYGERRLRWIGVAVFVCIGVAEGRVADEYVFQVSPLVAGIPWLLHFGLNRKSLALTLSGALVAFCCSWCNIVRSGTIAICMAFLLTMFVARYRIQKPFLPILLVVLACVPSALIERSLIVRRDVALARAGETATSGNSHPLWHTVYIGLGFIPNSEVSEYRDGVAGDKVRSIDPTVAYTSAKYEAILRHEVWNLLKRRPLLVIGILGAKAVIVTLLALILLYPVRRLMFAERAAFWVDAAFALAMGMSAMNGIVAVPRLSYLLTFLCLGFLYSSIKLCRAHRLSSRPLSP